jgi:suppressor of G2 allele of SKP1
MAQAALDQAKALFDEDKFFEAKTAAQAGIEAAGADAPAATMRSLKLLVRKCNTHLEEVPDKISAAAAAPAAPAPAAPAAAAAAPAPAAAAPAPKPQTSCRHEWFQTPTAVTYSFYVKNRTKDMVTVATEKRSFEITIKLDNDKEFQLTNEPLFGEIDPRKTEVSVKQPKVEVVLHKVIQGMHWSAIELKGEAAEAAAATTSAAPPASALPQSQQQLSYPNSKGRDWSKFKTDLEKEEEAKKNTLSGEEGLNSLFQQIYSNCSEENKRAMIKSFTESNGTVLSTNWEDVGSRKVEGEAPKGMEAKKWEQ